MGKKYELTSETIKVYGKTLHRIKALRDIGLTVKTGDLGGYAESKNNLSLYGNAWIYNDAKVFDTATVWGNATVSGNATVWDDAQLSKQTDVLTISPIGSRNDTTTFYRANGGKIFVKCGCKNTDIDEWLDMVKSTHGDNKHAKAYRLAAQIAKLQILGEEE